MRIRPLVVFATLLAAIAVPALSAAPAGAADKCEAATLSTSLHGKMKSEGKSDAEIRGILGSGFKRKVLHGRVVDGSGCDGKQVDKALEALAAAVKG
jgi:hypothetical protein